MPAAKARRFHGWIMLGVAVLMAVATMPGQTVIAALFNDSYRQALDLSITQLSAAYTIGTLLAAVPISWVGRMADRHGLRLVTGVVAIAFALALLLLSQVRGVVMLGVGFFLIRCLGQGCLSTLSGHVIAMWFERRLGMAHAVVSIGGFAAASALLPQPTAWLIAELGWRMALVVLAVFVLVMTLPAVMTVFRNRPEDVGQHLDGKELEAVQDDVGLSSASADPAFTVGEAMRTRAFWICTTTMVFGGIVGTALIFHMSSILQSAGMAGTPREVALAIQPWPLAFGIATLASGWLVDRLRPAPLLASGTALLGVAILLCLAASSSIASAGFTLPLMAAGMAVFGASQAMIVGVGTPTIARYFGRTHHGAIRGVVSATAVAATGVGPLLVGLAYEHLGQSFTPMLGVFAGCAVPLTLAALLLRRPHRHNT
jgi:MFS transporter, OFA family, oxalate/formate antiporter